MSKIISPKVKGYTLPDNFFLDRRIYPGEPGKKNSSPDGVYRLLDANFNRAREGLRIVEDVFRFVLPNQKIARKLKKIRLDLSKTTEKIYPRLIQARNVKNDFGRKGKEKKRKNLKDLVLANFSRAEEAVR